MSTPNYLVNDFVLYIKLVDSGRASKLKRYNIMSIFITQIVVLITQKFVFLLTKFIYSYK